MERQLQTSESPGKTQILKNAQRQTQQIKQPSTSRPRPTDLDRKVGGPAARGEGGIAAIVRASGPHDLRIACHNRLILNNYRLVP